MRIAVITSSYPRFPGDGTAPFVKSISEHLVKLGHNVEITAPYDPAVTPTESKVMVHRFRYIWPAKLHIMGHARALQNDARLRPLSFFLLPLFLISGFLSLLRITGQQRSQVIHAHWVIPNGLIAACVALLRGIPFIVSLHGSDIFIARRNPIFKAVARWVFHRAAGVTACSPELQQSALDLGASHDTRLLAWGADPNLFRPDRRNSKYRKTKYGPDQYLIIGALGRLVAKKGFDKLIQAMPAVLQNHPETRLVIGGDGDLKEKLQNQVQTLGISHSVQFLGAIPWDEVPDFLANVDIFVLPSIRDQSGNVDGLPTVLLEAMSSGVAVIASNIGGVSLVIESQHNGLLLPPGDLNALVEALTNLIKDEKIRTSMSREARYTIEEKHNWDQVGLAITELLQIATWRNRKYIRLGTIYRQQVLKSFKQNLVPKRVLDIGCHDGYLLSTLNAPVRIGVDLNPKQAVPGIMMIQADGCFLPFRKGSFDTIYALDFIEHIDDDQSFVKLLIQALSPNGILILSTPNKNIRLYPPFLTGWISRQWGHHLRLGYSKAELLKLFEDTPGLTIELYDWNAYAFRFWYLPIRLLSIISTKLAINIICHLAQYDSQHRVGENGFIILLAYQNPSPNPILNNGNKPQEFPTGNTEQES